MNRKYLIIRFSSLGDVVLTLPVVESIRQFQPQAEIDFLTNANYAPLVALFPGIGQVHSFSKEDPISIRKLRKLGYDTVIDLQKNPRSVIYTARINPRTVTSYPKRRWQRELLVRNSKLKFKIGHTVDAYLSALSRLKIPETDRIPRLALNDEKLKQGRDYLKEKGITGKIIALCPGSKHFEKRWPNFAELAQLLLKDPENAVIVFSDINDGFDAQLGLKSTRILACRGLSLDILPSVMSNCDIVVANDSGLMHLAVALGTPAIAIFGPTHPDLGFAPLGSHDKIICDHVACSPCSLHGEKKCRMPEKYCFQDITPERLYNVIKELINETSRGQILREASQ
jgi:heptosyltransferase II